MGSARIEKRSHGSKRPELRACPQRAECGSEPFLNVLIQLLMQLAYSVRQNPYHLYFGLDVDFSKYFKKFVMLAKEKKFLEFFHASSH